MNRLGYNNILLCLLCLILISCSDKQAVSSISSDSQIEDGRYLLAREHQTSGRWTDAIQTYEEILAYEPEGEPSDDDLLLISASLLQMMNSYQSASLQVECVEALRKIYAEPTDVIRNYLWRDLSSIYAYALYRADNDDLALTMIQDVLAMEEGRSDPNSLFRDYSYAGAIMFANPHLQKEAIRCCESALEIARQEEFVSGVQWVSSILGRLYKKNGMMQQAMPLLQESVEYAKEVGDIPGLVNSYNSLSDIFLFWKYTGQAESYSDSALSAIDAVRIQATSIAGDTYRIRGMIKNLKGENDSALYYLHKALALYEILPYNLGNDQVDKELGSILVKSESSSSREVGEKLLTRVISKASRPEPVTAAYVNLAQMHQQNGNHHQCTQLMTELSVLMEGDTSSVTYIDEDVCRFAFEYYMADGNLKAAGIFSDLYLQQVDRRSADNVSRVIASAASDDQKYRHQMQIHRSMTIVSIILLLTFITVVVIISSVYLYHRRKNRRAQVMVSNLEKDIKRLSAELNDMAHNISSYTPCESDGQVQLPQLFRKEGECVFREMFQGHYPNFLPKLRQAVANISRNEEILCMMIFLSQDLNQIAYNMGIEKNSVNQARYRLRKKMGLAKDESLKEKIMEIVE